MVSAADLMCQGTRINKKLTESGSGEPQNGIHDVE